MDFLKKLGTLLKREMQSIINSNHILLGTQVLVGTPLEIYKFDFSDSFVSNFHLREILKRGVSTCNWHHDHDFKISVILNSSA